MIIFRPEEDPLVDPYVNPTKCPKYYCFALGNMNSDHNDNGPHCLVKPLWLLPKVKLSTHQVLSNQESPLDRVKVSPLILVITGFSNH